MLSKFNLVQKVRLTSTSAELPINGRLGQIEKAALRRFLGMQLLREVLLQFHAVRSESVDSVLSRLSWQVRLLEHPLRISLSYWVSGKEGKQAKRFRILFRAVHVPNEGFILTTQSFRRGDEA